MIAAVRADRRMLREAERKFGSIMNAPHVTGRVVCRVCSHESVSVSPAVRALHDLECPNCGSLAMDSPALSE